MLVRNACVSLTDPGDSDGMEDCPDMINYFHAHTRIQVHLAVLAQAKAVAAMHIDLAQLYENRAQAAEEFCDEG